MAFKIKWFHFEVDHPHGGSLQEKIPAGTKAEADEKIRRMYPNSMYVMYKGVSESEALNLNFSRDARSAPKDDGPSFQVRCPHCQKKLSINSIEDRKPLQCPGCSLKFTAVREKDGKVSFELAQPESRRRLDCHQILGVSPGASLAELKRGYMEQVKAYHPDRVQGLGNELVELAESKTKEINWAYRQARDMLRAND